jgi:hypothetical protein
MSKTRLWVIGVIAGVLIIVIAGYVLGISPVLSQASAANVQAATIEAGNGQSQRQLASLKQQFIKIDGLKKKLNTLRLSIPEQQQASVFINEISALSAANGVSVQSIAVASATLYTAPVTATTTAPAATTATSTATPSPTAAPTTPAATTAVPASGLVLVPVTLSVQGTLAQDEAFLTALQLGDRLFLSSSFVLTEDAGGGTFTANIGGDIFTLQGTSDASPKTTLTPTPTPTPTATPTPTSTPTSSATTSSTKTGSSTAPSTAPSTEPTSTPTPSDSSSASS